MIPEEDKYLCRHDYKDLYGGDGVLSTDPYVAIVAFYCRWCLDIRLKTYSRKKYAISREFLEDFNQDNAEGEACV